jgi:hypothetical protein
MDRQEKRLGIRQVIHQEPTLVSGRQLLDQLRQPWLIAPENIPFAAQSEPSLLERLEHRSAGWNREISTYE